MATREQLEQALRAADAAGATADARRLAAALKNMRGPEANVPVRPPAEELYSKMPIWQKPLQHVADAGRLIGQGITLGGYDKLAGTVAPYIGGSDVEGQRQLTQDARDRGGVGGAALEMGSSVLPAFLTSGATALPAMKAGIPKALAALGIGGLEGVGYGGIQAVNEDRDVLEGMGRGALWGVGGQAASGLLSAGLNKLDDAINPPPKRTGVPELRAAKDSAYKAVDDMGVEYTPGTVRGMLAAMDNAAQPYPGRHDQVIAAKNQVGGNLNAGRPVTLPEVDLNRQIINRDLNSLPDRAQQDMGLDLTEAIDTTLNNVGPLGVTARSGDPSDGLAALNDARELNQRMRKLEQLDDSVAKAERRAARSMSSGEDTTLRSNIDNIMGNPKKLRGYTPDEVGAMDEVVRGTKGQNTARQIGRFAPGSGLSFTGMGGAATVAGLLSGGNPLMMGAAAAVPPAIGAVSKKLSERSTKKSVQNLLDLVAAGGTKATPKKSVGPAERDTLGRILMMLQMQQGNQ